jgi:hypothetical protein
VAAEVGPDPQRHEITFQNGDVRYSAGSGLSMIGRQGKVLNSVFRDPEPAGQRNRHGQLRQDIRPGQRRRRQRGPRVRLQHAVELAAAGHQLPRLKNSTKKPTDTKARIHHNLIHDVMLRSADSAAIDSLGTDHQYVRIDHNVIYNVTGKGRKYGIYFDFAAGGVVHHNLVYNVTDPSTSTGTRSEARKTCGCSTTWASLTSRKGVGWKPVPARAPGASSSTTSSLTASGPADGTAGSPRRSKRRRSATISLATMTCSSTRRTPTWQRGLPVKKTATDAINKGVKVPPYDDKLVGLPDIGAFELGVAPWTVGAGKMPTKSSK